MAIDAHRRTSTDPRLKKHYMVGELELDRCGVRERLTGIPLFDSRNLMIEKDRESVPVDDRSNVCIGWVTPERTGNQREQARFLGFGDIRAGFAMKRRSESEYGLLERAEVRYSDNVESMIFTAEYPDGTGSWDPDVYACSYSEWKLRRLWNINPMFRRNELYLFFLADREMKWDLHKHGVRRYIYEDALAKDL